MIVTSGKAFYIGYFYFYRFEVHMVNIINKAFARVQTLRKKSKNDDGEKGRDASLRLVKDEWAMSVDDALRASTVESYK